VLLDPASMLMRLFIRNWSTGIRAKSPISYKPNIFQYWVCAMDIKRAQEYIREAYYERDSARGVFATFTWFTEEVGELAEAVLNMDRGMLEEELADVFAWLLSIANLVGVDLEEAFKKKYLSHGSP